MQCFSQPPVTLSLLDRNILQSTPLSNTLNIRISPLYIQNLGPCSSHQSTYKS